MFNNKQTSEDSPRDAKGAEAPAPASKKGAGASPDPVGTWWRAHIDNSLVSRNTAAYNALGATLPSLLEHLAKASGAAEITAAVHAWFHGPVSTGRLGRHVSALLHVKAKLPDLINQLKAKE